MKKLAIFITLLALTACGQSGSKSAPTASTGSSETVVLALGGNSDTPVAELNGVAITEKELNAKIDNRLSRIKSQVFDIQRQGINSIINERLLDAEAKKQNTTVPELLKKNVNDKVGDISEQEMKDFYEKNKRRFRGKSYEQVQSQVKRQLYARKSAVFRNNFLDRLKEEAKVKVFITRPRIEVSVDDDPMRGNKDAVITVIEFTDYQCPFCSRARPTIQQVLDQYGDKVRYVLRDFPLNFHPQAKKAAEAAHCAGDQDKYWEYSDILWQNQRALDIPQLKKYAQDLKLNTKDFDQCLDSGKYSKEVEKDMADGSKAGVTGTPSFFINGQMLTGAQPFERFKETIDMELLTQKN